MTLYQSNPDGTIKPVPDVRLSNLYQETILEHNKSPRNFKEIANPTQYSHGYNPLCGDDYHIYLQTDASGVVQDIGFKGAGCAISKSSASMMTTLIKGKSLDEAIKLKDNFLTLLTQENVPPVVRANTGRMVMFEGVKEFPARVKCATIAWHALEDALKDVPAVKGEKS